MKIYKTSIIGTFHTNHNEDAITIQELDTNTLLIAVMDGCSMGKESHFASTLIAKILNKIAKNNYYKSFVEPCNYTPKTYCKIILKEVFKDLKTTQQLLFLDQLELLSTLIIGVINTNTKTAGIISIGDGLICVNEDYIKYEQEDKPDYLGYHLNKDFETWFAQQKQILSLNNIQNLSISTDGIFSFKPFSTAQYPSIIENQILDFFLKNKQWNNQENMLDRKVIELELKYGLKPSDDLSIISVSL